MAWVYRGGVSLSTLHIEQGQTEAESTFNIGNEDHTLISPLRFILTKRYACLQTRHCGAPFSERERECVCVCERERERENETR